MCANNLLGVLAVAAVLAATGCVARLPATGRPGAAGPASLQREADPGGLPDLAAAFAARDEGLLAALDRSLAWFDEPRSRLAYPFGRPAISHEQARAGLLAFREALRTSVDAAAFRAAVAQDFDLYGSTGSDGRGRVLFTGYFAPSLRASRARTPEFRFPLYGRPPDLAVEPGTEKVLGRLLGGRLVPYPTRAQIEADPGAAGLAGREVAWLASPLDAFLVQVQGSARLEPADGSPPFHVGYAGTNGRPYTSIGRLLVADGKIEAGKLSLPAIHAYFRDHPDELRGYLDRNERYVFFREAPAADWPAGSLGFPLTPLRSVATDKAAFPPGGVVLAATELDLAGGASVPFVQFLLDQDSGGAILGPGRADLFVGIGEEAGEVAGHQAHAGRLWCLVLKPERVAAWSGVAAR